MKNLKLKSITMHALLLILLLTGCEGKKEVRTVLGTQQLNYLTTYPAGTTIVFNEGGQLISTTVGAFSKYTSRSEPKVGMFSRSTIFYKEYGSVSYNMSNGQSKIGINAISDGGQNIYIYYPTQTSSSYSIRFDNKIPSKKINGVTYTDVVLGIDNIKHDTLFWKKNLGILGWKRSGENFTAYRVF